MHHTGIWSNQSGYMYHLLFTQSVHYLNPGGGESVFKIKLTQGEISKVKGLFNMVQYISRLNSVHKRNCDFFQNAF